MESLKQLKRVTPCVHFPRFLGPSTSGAFSSTNFIDPNKYPRSHHCVLQTRSGKKKREKSIEGEERSEMSWQEYVDVHLMCDMEGNCLTSAAIVGQEGSVWAQSESFPELKPEEIKAIIADFDNPGTLAPHGLYLGGTKYMVIQGEPGQVIRGKKGAGGACIKKTNQALVIGIYDEPMTPGQCNVVVERLGDYLTEQGI